MAFDEYLAERIKRQLSDKRIFFQEKRMFGGWCAMVDDKMCVGVVKNDLMVRVDPDLIDKLIDKKGARLMDFTGRPMKGYLFVSGEGYDSESDLSFWIDHCIAFNPKAKSKSRKPKS